MAEYQYTSKDLSGQAYSGVLEAESLDAFYRILKQRNQFCVFVRPVGAKSRDLNIFGRRIRLKELSIFCRQLSTMLTAGLPVIKCLDTIYEQSSGKRLKTVILGVYEAVQRGESLSHAMREQNGAFPYLMLNMIEAGEESGTLDTVMLRLADQYEKDNKTQNKIQQAMIYPAFIASLTVLIVVFMLTFILPRFIGMYRQFGGKLPPVTMALLALSNALTDYWYLFLAGIALIAVLCRAALRYDRVRIAWDRFKLRMPLLGRSMRIVEASRFSRTLASLFASGIPVIQSIEIVAKVIKNRYIKQGLGHVGEEVGRGVSLSDSVKRQGIFPPMLHSMLSIGEESGNMDEILNKTAAYYDEESDAAIQKMLAVIEPAMIVLLAVIVGFIILSIITPVFSLYSQINANANSGL